MIFLLTLKPIKYLFKSQFLPLLQLLGQTHQRVRHRTHNQYDKQFMGVDYCRKNATSYLEPCLDVNYDLKNICNIDPSSQFYKKLTTINSSCNKITSLIKKHCMGTCVRLHILLQPLITSVIFHYKIDPKQILQTLNQLYLTNNFNVIGLMKY